MAKQRAMELHYTTPEGKEAKRDISYVNTETSPEDVYNFGTALVGLTDNTLTGAIQKDTQPYTEAIDEFLNPPAPAKRDPILIPVYTMLYNVFRDNNNNLQVWSDANATGGGYFFKFSVISDTVGDIVVSTDDNRFRPVEIGRTDLTASAGEGGGSALRKALFDAHCATGRTAWCLERYVEDSTLSSGTLIPVTMTAEETEYTNEKTITFNLPYYRGYYPETGSAKTNFVLEAGTAREEKYEFKEIDGTYTTPVITPKNPDAFEYIRYNAETRRIEYLASSTMTFEAGVNYWVRLTVPEREGERPRVIHDIGFHLAW